MPGQYHPLVTAAAKGDIAALTAELRRTPREAVAGELGRSALFSAIHRGRSAAVKLLIEHGANPDAAEHDGMHAIRLAILDGHVETATLTWDSRSDEARRYYRASLLRSAAQAGIIPFIETLVSDGAGINDPDEVGWTPLMWAAMHGEDYAALRILELGGDPRMRDRHGSTAAELASESGYSQLAELLYAEAGTSEGS